MKKIKLHWITEMPNPYNNFLFETLAHEPHIDLMVHFTCNRSALYPWRSKFRDNFRSRTFELRLGIDWHLLHLAVKEPESFFVIGGWAKPTLAALMVLLTIQQNPFAIWTDTPNVFRGRNPIKIIFRNRWLKYIFQNAEYVMGTGQPALKVLKEMGCPSEKLVNFPYWIDLKRFQDVYINRYNRDDGDIVFLSVGRLLNSHKGYDLALYALRKVIDKRPYKNVRYRIAGTGPDYESLKLLAKQLGIIDHVEFVGWLEQEDLVGFLSSGDVFLHSAYFEPYGVVILEAMGSGLVVIASDKTMAAKDRITHLQNGLIFETGNVNDLVNQMLFCVDNSGSLSNIGAEARRTAEQWPIARAIETVHTMLDRCFLPPVTTKS